MATTQKGIYYPDNYSAVADIPADMQDLAESVDATLDGYQEKVSGKGLSTNDFTNADKEKLEGIEAEANKTIVDNALNPSSTNPVQNKKVYEALEGKVDKVTGKGLSEEDYTTAEKTKLSNIEAEANKTIVDDELDDTSTNPVQNKVLKEIIDEQAEEITALKNQIPTESVSGESIDIYDSSDLEFEEFEVEGRSTQAVTNGYQLIHITQEFHTYTSNGITFETYPDGTCKVYGTATAVVNAYLNCNTGHFTNSNNSNASSLSAGDYVYHATIIKGDLSHTKARTGSTNLTEYGNDKTFTLENDITDFNLYFRINNGVTVNDEFKIMLEKGTTIHDWESYTGGTASPNPSYPQPIYSAGDNNSITEKIYTGNIFNKNDSSLITNAYINSTTKAILTSPDTRMLHVSCSPNTTYTISKIVSARFTVITSIDYTYSAGAIGTNIASDPSATSLTITSGANDRYICVFYYFSDVDTLSEKTIRDSILIEPGPIAHSYTDKPFAEQNITIPCQQPMISIGDLRDEFVKVNGTWYERHNINSIVLTGEEDVTKGTNAKRIIISTFSQLNYCTNSGTRYTAQCSHENSIRSAASTESNSGMGFYNSKIWWNNDYFENMTAEQAQTFIAAEYTANHPIIINHTPTTPTDLPCTEAQIEVLEGLKDVHSYRTTTHIYSNDTTPATVNATYRKDLTTMFNKLNTLEARIELLEN